MKKRKMKRLTNLIEFIISIIAILLILAITILGFIVDEELLFIAGSCSSILVAIFLVALAGLSALKDFREKKDEQNN